MDFRRILIAVMLLAAVLNVSAQSATDGDPIAKFDSLKIKRHLPAKTNIAVGINHRTADSLRFSSLNIGLLGDVDTLRGFQLNLLTDLVRREMRGVNIAVLHSSTNGKAYGVQLTGMFNAVNGEMRGLQISGVANIARQANGIQLSGFSNVCTSPMRGIQLSGITNIAMGVKRGLQISVAANICSSYMRGIQLGMHNYADTLNGWQIGLVNACVSHPRGVQIGIVNYSRDTVSRKIGLVNVNPRTRIDLMAYGGTSSKLNIAVRFRNRSTYNIIGVGTHYMGFDEQFSGALFYRLGQYFTLSPRWSLSGDIGYFHVETFEKNSDEKPERLFSIQARLNVDYQITKVISAFATVGYGDTRYYDHARRYRDRMIGEAGICFRLIRK